MILTKLYSIAQQTPLKLGQLGTIGFLNTPLEIGMAAQRAEAAAGGIDKDTVKPIEIGGMEAIGTDRKDMGESQAVAIFRYRANLTGHNFLGDNDCLISCELGQVGAFASWRRAQV